MTPRSSLHDISDAFGDNPEVSGKLCFREKTISPEPSNVLYLFFCEFVKWVSFTATARALFRCITVVFRSRSQPQMLRIYTSPVITIRTIMQDALAFWNWTKVQNPTCYMGVDGMVSFIAPLNTAVTHTLCSDPNPTSIGLFDFGPKAFNKGLRKSLRSEKLNPIVRPLDQLHFDWVRLQAVTGRAGAISFGGYYGN